MALRQGCLFLSVFVLPYLWVAWLLWPDFPCKTAWKRLVAENSWLKIDFFCQSSLQFILQFVTAGHATS